MYLKSLTLKGFKSFADRSVLTLEPGITAVVGPNGSGKSNISDAVLWVLGERNAKNLRGQAMEDVIFAGSSARKSVSVAEVELVLDNSDHTLPVDFDEVSIARRMYRSGESEYLINGAVVRRLDVLDILHDSGLGTGTHSIISQGSLDSILQSKPEDRRALIEEAAGVLKHKQRKAKSERKLANMDIHLMRVRDIAQEVRRQLGPLQRKANKAREYQSISAQLADLDLAIAVDNLRALRSSWAKVEQLESQLKLQLDEKKEAAAQAEKVVEALQQRIQTETIDAGVLADKHRRASLLVERMDGVELVFHEKKRSAKMNEADVRVSLESDKIQYQRALEEKTQALNQLKQAQLSFTEAEANLTDCKNLYEAALEQRRTIEQELEVSERALREDKNTLETLRRDLAETQESLSSGLAHIRLIEGHKNELASRLQAAEADEQQQKATLETLRKNQTVLTDKESKARSQVADAISARNEAQSQLENKREELLSVVSQIRGLEEVERALNATNAARSWLLDNLDSFNFGAKPVSRVIRAEQGYESLVEYVLGSEVSTLVVESSAEVLHLIDRLQSHNKTGRITLLSTDGQEGFVCPDMPTANEVSRWGELLLEKVTYPENCAQAVQVLLGDIVVCESAGDALRGCRESKRPLRFVTKSLSLFDSQGRLSVGTGEPESNEGELARVRHIEEAQKKRACLETEVAQLQERLNQAELTLHTTQAQSLELSQRLAELKGKVEAAQTDLQNAAQKTSSLLSEYESIESQRQEAAQSVAEARPSVESQEVAIAKREQSLQAMQKRIDEAREQVLPLRKQAAHLRDTLAEAKLKVATLSERQTYAARMVEARQSDVVRFEKAVTEAQEQLDKKALAQRRIDPLLAVFAQLAKTARVRTQAIELKATTSQSASASLHSEIALARTVAHTTREALDKTNAALSEVRVDKGRLEVQVESALSTIVDDCGVPLDHALNVPVLDNREQAMAEADALKRRIKSLGAINLDAASEYEELKQRYDYLSLQLEDLETARRSLDKIVRVIDRRMKDDFVRTFGEVNKNFQEIFAILFPGGSAHLSLVDPEDTELSGVEVTAQPRGKRITKMMLMSGGEKSLTALALLFAVYRIRTTPFYILDEVEAALDDSNLRRLTEYFTSLRTSTQLILITHQRRTMEMADVLFGVSMQSDGITKVVSQKLDRALQYAQD